MGSTLDALKEREESLLCNTYARYPLSIVKGRGSHLWDKDGKEYIDFLSGIAVTSLGHSNEELADIIQVQAQKLIHVSNLFYQEEQLDLAQSLLSTCHMEKIFFCNSGAEANEAAVKIARRYMQKVKNRNAYEIITFSGCFHGRTLAMLAAQNKFQEGFEPMPSGFVQIPFGDIDALKNAINPCTAAVLIEIIQGEGGIHPINFAYAQNIAKLCKDNDILFMVDDVQAGMCRSGKFWSFQHHDLFPDVFTSAKAIANGLPMGAMLTTNEVAQAFCYGTHGTTYGGGPLISAVANKVIEIMKRDELAQRAQRVGGQFMHDLNNLALANPGNIMDVRGLGFMIGIELSANGKEIWLELLQSGFICNLSQDKILRLLPALNIPEADLEAFIICLGDILKKYRV